MTDLRTAAQQALAFTMRDFASLRDFEAAKAVLHDNLRTALAQQKDPTDPGNDVDVLREHVRHLERRVRQLHAQQAEPDLSRCPQCNGPADNGFDRSFPPSPYLCKKCMAEPVGPVAWEDWWQNHGQYNFRATAGMTFERAKELMKLAFEVGREAAPPQQAEPVEPVAWMVYTEGGTSAYVTDNPNDLVGAYRALPLYTAPPQRKPLTEEEIKTAFHAARNAKLGASQDNSRHRLSVIEIARAVEKASWEKNHG